MFKNLYLILFLSFTFISIGQNRIDKALERHNKGSITYIDVNNLKEKLNNKEDLFLLDTRTLEEYEVSHIKNATWVGYKKFDKSKVKHLDKTKPIVVYCSIGVRSEKIGEKLLKLGFVDVKNLYGGIFQWVNEGYPVFINGLQTQKIHAFNKSWGKSLKRGQKVF